MSGAAAGLLVVTAIWVIGQDFGQLYTGQATDPNTAPLIGVLAVALLFGYRRPASLFPVVRRHARSGLLPQLRAISARTGSGRT
jgi:hypothetical protein